MKKLILFSTLFFSYSFLFAQHETDIWYFGTNAGISFSGGPAAALNGGAMNTSEGCSSISDGNGNSLLFYTDGISVWNKNNQPMPNGTGLAGGVSTQAALIVPMPQSASLYYIFTNDAVSGTNGFQYSVVDMSLDSGRGDVTMKNIFIKNNLTEKLTAVANSQNDGYWIGVHEFGTDTFFTYRLLSSGLDSIPVISETGIRYSNQIMGNAYGQMKFSPCGNKLLAAEGYLDTVEVFDFDNSTGIISNPISLNMPAHVFGAEFSPDGQKIYISTYSAITLYQYDLSSGNPGTILASATGLSIQPDTYGLQLGIDGKIYVVKSFSTWLGAITDPDVAGPSCNYVDTALNLDPLMLGQMSGLCLPGFVQSYFRNQSMCLGTGIRENNLSDEIIYPNPTSASFNIKVNSGEDVFVFDINGRLVEKINSSERIVSFGNNLDAGIYFVRIFSGKMERVIKAVKF